MNMIATYSTAGLTSREGHIYIHSVYNIYNKVNIKTKIIQ